MSEEPLYVRATAIVATSDRIEAYGGYQAPRELLDQMVSDLNSGSTPWHRNHDPRQPFEVRSARAELEQDGDRLKVVVHLEVNAEHWAAHQAEIDALGAPGGMSFTVIETFAAVGGPPESTQFLLAVDAQVDDDEIANAAQGLWKNSQRPVKVSRLRQFSYEPALRVVIEMLPEILHSVPLNILSNWLYDALVPFIRPRRRTHFEVNVRSDSSGSRAVHGVIDTGSTRHLRMALDSLEQMTTRMLPVVTFEDGEWRDPLEGDASPGPIS